MSIPKCKDFSDYNHYPSDANPTTDADMQEYMANQNDLMKIVSSILWQPQTNYEVGQEARSNAMPSGCVAIAITSGVSGTSEPEWSDIGETTIDGSVVWEYQQLAQKVDKADVYTKDESDSNLALKANQVDLETLAGTSEIVASGDNYIRYANGKQICYGSKINAGGSQSANFAVPFINTAYTLIVSVDQVSANIWANGRQTTNAGIYTTASGGIFHWFAIGNWK